MIFLSRSSVAKRGYVQREMKMALDAWQESPEGTIHTIPVRLDDCDVPESFRRYHYTNLFEPNGFDRIVRAIHAGIAKRLRHRSAIAAGPKDAESQFRLGYRLYFEETNDKDDYERYAVEHNVSKLDAIMQLGDLSRAKACEWFRKAAEQDHPEAQFWLGWALDSGLGVEQDSQQAFKWWLAAAKNGSDRAQVKVGKLFLYSKEFDTARSWFRKAAEQGNNEAMYQLGEMFANAWGVRQSRKESAKWYRAAAVNGHTEAAHNLGCLLLNEDPTESVKWFKEAAEKDHMESMAFLGSAYLNGDGIEQDTSQALQWLTKSAEADNKFGQFLLGCVYLDGRGGVEADLDRGIDWLKKSAASESSRSPGYVYAQRKLGNTFLMAGMKAMVEEKKEITGPLYSEAARWFTQAAEQDDIESLGKLGILYERGMGVEENREEAIRLYRQAADKSDDFAIKQLRKMGVV